LHLFITAKLIRWVYTEKLNCKPKFIWYTRQKSNMNQKMLRNTILTLLLVIICFGSGYKAGLHGSLPILTGQAIDVTNKTAGKPINTDFSLFWNVWDRLERTYVDKKALDAKNMINGAISGMVASLADPYTVYLPPDQNKEAKDDLGGRFEGIGAQLGIKDKKIIVIAPLKGSPAEAVGLQSGDWIVKVDNKETLNWTLPEAVSKIRGTKGSKVLLTVIKKDASVSADLTVTRDEIKVASVEEEIKNVNCDGTGCRENKEVCLECKKVVYLKLSRFGDSTNTEWDSAVSKVLERLNSPDKADIKGLIFDLRNNPGGYLTGSVFIASEFLNDGTVVIQESSNGVKQTYTVNRKGKLLGIPMIVLINKGSASAAEIVAGALHDRGRAKLLGETTFGKGSIQEAQELPGGAGIHITTAKWLIPSGKWINGTGIDPDVKVALDEKLPDKDTQLEKAMELLVK
jgi:carboxyl-terminal processing protease